MFVCIEVVKIPSLCGVSSGCVSERIRIDVWGCDLFVCLFVVSLYESYLIFVSF